MPSFEGNLLTQRHQIISVETRDPRLPYGENPKSLSRLGLIRYRVVTPQTDGQTDRITKANTRSQQYLTLQLSRVKNEACVSYATMTAGRVDKVVDDRSFVYVVECSHADHILSRRLCNARTHARTHISHIPNHNNVETDLWGAFIAC